jgi:hypothetical protein
MSNPSERRHTLGRPSIDPALRSMPTPGLVQVPRPRDMRPRARAAPVHGWRPRRVALYALFVAVLAAVGGYAVGYFRAVGDMGGGIVELPIVGARGVSAR